MGRLIVLMGPTGAGKSVQGDQLASELGGVHLSSGEILRSTPETAPLVVGGKLVSAAVVEQVVGEAIDRVPVTKPIVLDGFPRTMSNVNWLDQKLPQHGRDVSRVVLLELDLETVLERLRQRSRVDDTDAAIETKWREYEDKTHEVIEHYERSGLLARVDGRGTVDEVAERVLEAVRAEVA